MFVSVKLDEFRGGTIESLLGTANFMFGDGNVPGAIYVEE